MTLKFLGWANPEIVDPIRDRLREGLAGRKDFSIAARGLGAFPEERHPRVLWVGLDDSEGGLATLARDVEGWMETLGFARESRAFHPHLTIGRVKEPPAPEAVEARFAPVRHQDFGTSLVREVVPYESQVLPGGSEYVPLARVPLTVPPCRAERQTRGLEEDSTENEEPDHGGQSA